MDVSSQLNTRMNKATITNAIRSFSNIGKEEINKNSYIEIDYNPTHTLEPVTNSNYKNNDIITDYDFSIPSSSKNINKKTRSITNLIVRPSEVKKKDEKTIYLNNNLNISVKSTDSMVKPVAILARMSIGIIHNVTMANVNYITNTVSSINRFQNEVDNNFFNNTIYNIGIINNNFERIANSIGTAINLNKSVSQSDSLKEQIQSLIYTENMLI